jgi:hypothetical protein
MKQTIATEKAPKAIGPYSQAVVYGGLAYLSGQIAIDPANNKRPRDPPCRPPNCRATSASKSTSSPPLPSRDRKGRSVRRVLRLRRIEGDLQRLLFLVNIEILPKRLVVFRDDLHQNRPLGDGRNLG